MKMIRFMAFRIRNLFFRWTLAAILMTGFGAAMPQEFDPRYPEYADPLVQKRTAVEIGKCRIYVIGAAFWRDWMPIVSRPGPDRGSQLHAVVSMRLENPTPQACRLAFQTKLIDGSGQPHLATFKVNPNFRVLPDDVAKQYRFLSAERKREVIEKYNVVWDGSLQAGERRTLELQASDGPYLPIGSHVHVVVTWINESGISGVVKTLEEYIKRTD